MPIRHALWTVSTTPIEVQVTPLEKESLLHDMIVAEPKILSSEWMLIGSEVDTRGTSGRIDLLAIAPDGGLILIELKKDRASRDVVAQALDYACWVEERKPADVVSIYSKFAPGRSLAQDFQTHFGQPLEEDSLNSSHQIVIVAASLDPKTERIIKYLNDRDLAINVLFFEVFQHGEAKFLSRAWLIDPVESQVNAASTPDREKEPWNGEFYACFGESDTRSWTDAVKYGFISGGGGSWYSNTLNLLDVGDRVWVKVPGRGFVGVGRVTGPRISLGEFKIGDLPAIDVLSAGYHRAFIDDPDRAEYFVPIDWQQTVPLDRAVQEVGMFGNQNTVCKPKTPLWRTTVERLKQRFPNFD